MKLKTLGVLILSAVISQAALAGCGSKGSPPPASAVKEESQLEHYEERSAFLRPFSREERAREIYLAGGCFWGTEGYFARLPGVLFTEAGYANGLSPETSYYELKKTGHAETVHLRYDPEIISLAELLERFYLAVDPLSVNKQGNDVGTQYRTGIYYTDEASRKTAECSLEQLARRLGRPSAIELLPLQNYVRAEDYHQDYLVKNPGGYCHIDLGLARQILYPASLFEPLALAAELPKAEEKEPGIYVSEESGRPLFASEGRLRDGEDGRLRFSMPLYSDALIYRPAEDRLSAELYEEGSETPLGEVRAEGENLAYLIGAAKLRFIPRDKLEASGLGRFLAYLPEA